ncbi:glycosyltransferase family 2 protein [Candidatus Woesebacteria bacterium]|nr:glycosyltransferase family 2 protein [Candidatus Woesebacteria bacterium]
MKKLAVVIIPTYNERENIGRTLDTILPIFDSITDWRVEVLVVDDTSPDKTYELVREYGKKDQRVHLLLNATKSGLGGAYNKGMSHAFTKLNADVVFEFDADLSHDPKKFADFLLEIDRGADMVLGTRYKFGGSMPADWGLHRKFLSYFGNLVIMTVLGDFRYRDWTSGYRAVTRKVFETVSPLLKGDRFTGYTFQIGSLYYAIKAGFKVVEAVPYAFVDRTVGVSKIGPEYLKNTLLFIFRMRIEELLQNRVVKFALVGGVGTLVQLISLQLFRHQLTTEQWYELAVFLSIETAIVSNYILNSLWTFNDKKIPLKQIPGKFIAFNLSSFGSILIQMALAAGGKATIGIRPLFTLPFVNMTIDTGLVYVIVGIGIGMVWNFFAYTRLIWKTK